MYVRLSVYLSVTHHYSVETAKHILKLFSPSGSHTIPVFPHQTVWYSNEYPAPSVSVDCTGYEKIAIFRRISRFISEMILDRAIVTIKYKIIGSYTRPTQGCHFE